MVNEYRVGTYASGLQVVSKLTPNYIEALGRVVDGELLVYDGVTLSRTDREHVAALLADQFEAEKARRVTIEEQPLEGN